MTTRPRKRRSSKSKTHTVQTNPVEIGVAFTMPDRSALEAAEDVQIDFQAKQDSISETRRSPGPALAPKVKRTSAKPSPAKETKI